MASTVKHLRSSTANKRPTASGLADGQLAINTASGTPGLFLKDNAGAVVKVGPVHVGAAAPNATPAGSSGNSKGELWVNDTTTIHGLNYFSGSAFVNLTPSGTTTAAGLVELATDAETQTGTDTIRAVTPSGLQSKVSDSTSTTSSTTIASSTAVKAAFDLANAALPRSGGRVTGNLEIGPTGSLSFEGSTDDGFETFLAVVDPTADRTITFPNVTGTVVTTGDTGTVTSTMITDGTIVNADINASAGIVDTKLATISTAGKVSNSATTAVSTNTVNAIVTRDGSGNFSAGTITAALTGNASTATKLSSARTFAVTGDITGTVSSDLTSGASIATSIAAGVIINADVNASAAIGLSKLATGALPSGITVASANIVDGTIVNADVNASAAIAGTKIAPNFGSQTITTTGVISPALGTAAAPSIAFTGDLNTGIFSPGADQVAVATNGAGRLFINASGNVGIGTSTPDLPLHVTGGVVTNSNISNLSNIVHGLSIPQGQSSARYLLLVKNAINGGSVAGRIIGKRRNVSGNGRNGVIIDFGIYSRDSGGGQSVAWVADTFVSDIALVTLDYDDGSGVSQWFAIDAVLVGTSSPFDSAYFDGGVGNASFTWVAEEDVSNVGSVNANTNINFGGKTYITAAGNVGIGTTSPNELLEVAGNIHLSGADRSIFNRSNNALTFGTNNTERARIDSSGRLLVGTSSTSSTAVGIFQGSALSPTGPGRFLIARGSDNPSDGFTLGSLDFADSGHVFATRIEGVRDGGTWTSGSSQPTRLVFSTTADGASSPTEQMRINSSGDLLIGKTVNNDTASGIRLLSNGSSSYVRAGVTVLCNRLESNGNIVAFRRSGTEVGTISVTTTATAYNTSSDYRLKENVVDLDGAIDRLKLLPVHRFNFIADPDTVVDGFIAHEAAEVVPECVTGTKDEVDEDGNPQYQGIDQSKMVPLVVAALQECIKKVESLEAEVASLKAKA
jgi:hypothetical protein